MKIANINPETGIPYGVIDACQENNMDTLDGAGLRLTCEAYPSGGSFPVGTEAIYSGKWYEATATDDTGNDYIVRWTDVNWGAEDASDACDWGHPDYIEIM